MSSLIEIPRTTRTFKPQMPRDKVERLYAGWKTAVERVL
jgi:glycerol kinase